MRQPEATVIPIWLSTVKLEKQKLAHFLLLWARINIKNSVLFNVVNNFDIRT